MSNNDRHEIVTLHEVAAYLRCHESTIYRLIKRGILHPFKTGRDWKFRWVDIEDYCQHREQ